MTIRTVPASPIAVYQFTLTAETNSKVYWDAVTYLLAQFPSIGASNVSAYTYLYPNTTAAQLPGHQASFEVLFALVDPPSPSTLADMWEPCWSHVNKTWPNQTVTSGQSIAFGNLYELFQKFADDSGAGVDKVVGSRLLPAETLTDDAFHDALIDFVGPAGARLYMVSGKGVWNAKPRGGSNAVNPAWRKALIHAGQSTEPSNITARRSDIS